MSNAMEGSRMSIDSFAKWSRARVVLAPHNHPLAWRNVAQLYKPQHLGLVSWSSLPSIATQQHHPRQPPTTATLLLPLTMTRTARAAYPRAVNKDRSESRSGLDTSMRKSGAGHHNWGSIADEQQLEAAALEDEGVSYDDNNPTANDMTASISSCMSSCRRYPTFC